MHGTCTPLLVMLLGGSKEPPFCLFVLHQKCKSSPPEVREQVIRSFNHLFFLLSLSLSLSPYGLLLLLSNSITIMVLLEEQWSCFYNYDGLVVVYAANDGGKKRKVVRFKLNKFLLLRSVVASSSTFQGLLLWEAGLLVGGCGLLLVFMRKERAIS